MLVWLGELRAPVWIGVDIMQVGVVLQVTLAGFVTGRAIKGVVDQVHLKDVLPRFHGVWRVRQDLDTLGELGGTGFDQSAAFAENLDGTNAAGAPRSHERLEAEIWHLNASQPGCVQDACPLRDRHFLAIDRAGDQLWLRRCHHV
jgi:hypothetical protein